MSLTQTENGRIQSLEKKVNDLQTALNNVSSTKQMKTLLTIRQAEIEDLKTRVSILETQIQTLQ